MTARSSRENVIETSATGGLRLRRELHASVKRILGSFLLQYRYCSNGTARSQSSRRDERHGGGGLDQNWLWLFQKSSLRKWTVSIPMPLFFERISAELILAMPTAMACSLPSANTPCNTPQK